MDIEDNKVNLPQAIKTNDNNNLNESNYAGERDLLAEKMETKPKVTSKSQFLYQKRTGTSGLGGQLYETKLLSLILLRLLKDNDVKEFHLGTNVDGIGAFDDIVFRYKINELEKPKIVFVQAKHRDEPDKRSLSIDEVLQEKYLDSYIRIKNKFDSNSEDDIFNGAYNDVECSFVFYTPAVQKFRNNTVICDTSKQYLITGDAAKVVQFDYKDDDIASFVQTVLYSRCKLLAKTFMKFILKGNYHNMMTDDLIKTYHVFLAYNVLDISSTTGRVLNGKFSNAFLKSDDYLLICMRDVIYKKIMSNNKSTSNVEVLAKSFSFKLPYNFGNLNFCINGESEKRNRRINYLCLKLKQLLESSDENKVIKVNDDMIGPEEILQHNDLEIYRLGGLVGNLLIADSETGMLKFNINESILSEDACKIYEQLKSNCPNITDLTKYRLNIDCYRFPKLTLYNTLRDRKLVKDFLKELKFYTKQAQEDEVERILKNEINEYCNFSGKDNISLYRIKGDAVYLKVHNELQKWWKQHTKAHYLTKSNNFYKDAKEEIFNSSMLSIFNYFCTKKIINIPVRFKETVINALLPDKALKSNNILNIVTRDIIMTSAKLRECLLQMNQLSPVFLDLQLIISEDCFESTLKEIKNSNIQLLVILCKSSKLSDKLMSLLKSTRGFVIVITEWMLDIQVTTNIDNSQNVLQIVDEMTAFVDLTDETQNELLHNNIVVYQGLEIVLGKLLNKSWYHLINTSILHIIISKETITIGKNLKTSKYNELKEFYIEQNMSRCIKVNLNASLQAQFTVFIGHAEDALPTEDQDIILISDNNQEFDTLCEKYSNHNIHWFYQNGKDYVWKKSFGKLNRLLHHIERTTYNISHLHKPMTLLDIEERVVILSGEPGMGKSTLMTYLSVQTKAVNPELWIIQINLINYKSVFSSWQENKVNIDLKDVMKFIFAASCVRIDEKADRMSFNSLHYDIFDVIIAENGARILANKEKGIHSISLLEIELFCDCYNNGQIVLLLDGFDEITPDYTKVATTMMEVLKNSNVCRLWITSRSYNILNELQISLGTFSFTLMPLSTKEQKCYLEKVWASKLSETVNDRLSFYVNRFYETMSLAINDKDNKFASVPLHLHMISEIYQNFFKEYYDPYVAKLSEKYMQDIKDVSNLISFYERFVEIKFYKIRFGEKKPFICTKDPDMKKMIERERKEFIENHKLLAAYSIFDKNVEGLFTENEIIEIYEIMESIKLGEEKTGIVDQVVDNVPKFIHFTYAEYFATEYLSDKLKSKNCSVAVWVYLFETIFTTFANLRKFFECKLQKDQELFELSSNKMHKIEVFNILLKQLESSETTLCITIKELSTSTTTFILNSMKAVTTTENLVDFIAYVGKKCKLSCAFCFAVDNRLKCIVRLIMDIVQEVDKTKIVALFKCGDIPNFNALGIVVNYVRCFTENVTMLDILLENVDSDTLLELFIMPCNLGLRAGNALHVLVLNYDTLINIKKYLLKFNKKQLMRLFSATDADSKTPAHFAGQHGDESFFDILKELLDADQFTRICTIRDPTGNTPAMYLKANIHHWHRLQAVINDTSRSSEFVKIYPI